MGADGGRHVTLFGLEVTDDAGYARDREAMAPILARHGGGFGCERFFAAEEHRAVRARWFEPSVGAVEVLEEVDGVPRDARPNLRRGG